MIKTTYVDTWEEPTSFEDFIESLRYSSIAQRACVITGSLGLWNGSPEIVLTVCGTMEEAIYKCVNKCDECRISQHASTIIVEGFHHDGTNRFEIHVLNEKGRNADESRCDLSRREYHLTLKDYLI
jgi:hypothetical protein